MTAPQNAASLTKRLREDVLEAVLDVLGFGATDLDAADARNDMASDLVTAVLDAPALKWVLSELRVLSVGAALDRDALASRARHLTALTQQVDAMRAQVARVRAMPLLDTQGEAWRVGYNHGLEDAQRQINGRPS